MWPRNNKKKAMKWKTEQWFKEWALALQWQPRFNHLHSIWFYMVIQVLPEITLSAETGGTTVITAYVSKTPQKKAKKWSKCTLQEYR